MKFSSVKIGEIYYERTDYHLYIFLPSRVDKTGPGPSARGIKKLIGLEIKFEFSGGSGVAVAHYNEMNWSEKYNRRPIALGKPDNLTDQEMKRAIRAIMEKK